jgi:hypothetical protein
LEKRHAGKRAALITQLRPSASARVFSPPLSEMLQKILPRHTPCIARAARNSLQNRHTGTMAALHAQPRPRTSAGILSTNIKENRTKFMPRHMPSTARAAHTGIGCKTAIQPHGGHCTHILGHMQVQELGANPPAGSPDGAARNSWQNNQTLRRFVVVPAMRTQLGPCIWSLILS